jgi:hypothetical protein
MRVDPLCAAALSRTTALLSRNAISEPKKSPARQLDTSAAYGINATSIVTEE